MKKILVIDDEPLQLELISDRLKMEFSEEEISIDTALNLRTAEPLIANNHYDIVVTDLLMNEQNSKDEILKLSQRLNTAKIIVYTVEPDAFPVEYIVPEQTFVVDKMKPFEDGIGIILQKIINFNLR